MKALLLILLISIASAHYIDIASFNSDVVSVVQYLDGYFQYFGITDWSDALQCVNDDYASMIMTFMPEILDLGCKAEKSNLEELRAVVYEFILTFPPGFGLCLDATLTIKQLRQKMGYPIDMNRVHAYVLMHFSSVKSSVCAIESSWTSGEFYQAGEESAALVQRILGVNMQALEQGVGASVQYNLQDFLNGLFNSFGLANPTDILNFCVDSSVYTYVFNYVPTVLNYGCKTTFLNVQTLVTVVNNLFSLIPKSYMYCIYNTNDYNQLIKKIGKPSIVYIIAYASTHVSTIKNSFCSMQTSWKAQNYNQAGAQTATLIKYILGINGLLLVNTDGAFLTIGNSAEPLEVKSLYADNSIDADEAFLAIDNIREQNENSEEASLDGVTPAVALQDFLNGFFSGFNLPNPKTILKCTPPDSYTQFFNFLGSLFGQLCKITVATAGKVIYFVYNFLASLPPSIGYCLEGNVELEQLRAKIGKVDINYVISYFTAHLSAIKKSFCAIYTSWNAGNYQQAGKQTAVLVKQILGINGISQVIDADEAFLAVDNVKYKSQCKKYRQKRYAIDADEAFLAIDNVIEQSQKSEEIAIQNATPEEALQTFLNSFFGGFSLPNPTTTLQCVPSDAQASIFNFLPGIFGQASQMTPRTVRKVLNSVKQFSATLPDTIAPCLKDNLELKYLKAQFGTIDISYMISYCTINFGSIKKSFSAIYTSWNAGNYQYAGAQAATLVNQILGLNGAQVLDADEAFLAIDNEPKYNSKFVKNIQESFKKIATEKPFSNVDHLIKKSVKKFIRYDFSKQVFENTMADTQQSDAAETLANVLSEFTSLASGTDFDARDTTEAFIAAVYSNFE